MKVERRENEIVVRFSPGTRTSKIQSILDYLRYEELTAQSAATQDDVDNSPMRPRKEGGRKLKEN